MVGHKFVRHTARLLKVPTSFRDFALTACCAAVLVVLAGCAPTIDHSAGPPPRAELSAALAGRGDATPEITVVSPDDEATVTSPVALRVKFEQLAPTAAGATVDGEGHLHVLVNEPCVLTGMPIPKNDTHVHFGNGAADIDIELAPGTHELCVQVGDGFHAAVAVTDSLTVNVVDDQ